MIRNTTDSRVPFKNCRLLEEFTAALATDVVGLLIVNNSDVVFVVAEAGMLPYY